MQTDLIRANVVHPGHHVSTKRGLLWPGIPLDSSTRLRLALVSLLLLAFTLRSGAVLALGEPTLHGNESINVARSLAAGRGFAFDFYKTRPDNPLVSFIPPLFPLLIATCLRFFANPALALLLIQAGLSSLTVWLVYEITHKLNRNPFSGLLAAGCVALYPVYLAQAASPGSVTFHIFLLALLLWSWLKLRERLDARSAALTGLVYGLTLLARPNLLGLLPLWLLWLWLNAPRPGRAWLRPALILIATALLTVSPWLLRDYQIHGQFLYISSNSGFNLWNGNNPFTTGSGHEVDRDRLAAFQGRPADPAQPARYELQPYPLPPAIEAQQPAIDEIELDRQLRRAALTFIRENPRRWAELALAKFKGFWWFRDNVGYKYEASWATLYKPIYAVVLLLTLAGLALSRRDWRNYLLLYSLLAYSTLTVVVFHVQTRFRWEVEAFFFVFVALALLSGWQTISKRTQKS